MKSKILVIEDELEVTDTLKRFLEDHGVEALTASTGEEGLMLLEASQPDLVLLDMRPGSGISGMEVLRRAKAAKSKAEFIVLTAVEDRNVAQLAKGLGASDYVTKPIHFEDLKRIVLSKLTEP